MPSRMLSRIVRSARARPSYVLAAPSLSLWTLPGLDPDCNSLNARASVTIRAFRVSAPQRVTVRYHGSSPGSVAADCQKLTGPDTIDEFLKLVADGGATIEDAKNYLQKMKARIDSLPLEERRREAANAGAGRILNWLWQSRPGHKKHDFDRAFSDLICWFLLPEGHEQLVWDWVELESAATKEKYGDAFQGAHDLEDRWTAWLAAGMMYAHVKWAPGGSTDNAILALQSFVLRLNNKGLYRYMYLLAPFMQVGKAIKSEHSCGNTDLFDWFCKSNPLGLAGPSRQRNRAELLLYHPSAPNPRPWVEFLSSWRSNPDPELFHVKIVDVSRLQNHIGHVSLRAAFILRAQGHEQGAKELEDFVREHHQPVWYKRDKIWRQLTRDPKLRRYKHSIDGTGTMFGKDS